MKGVYSRVGKVIGKQGVCVVCNREYFGGNRSITCSKECKVKRKSITAKQWLIENIGHVAERRRKYNEWYKKENIARKLVWHYVKVGKIIKPEFCIMSNCEVSSKLEAHHPFGYEGENKLKVRFLCVKHHKKEHEK